MTKQDILNIAMAQSAEDMGCQAADFRRGEPVLVPLRLGAGARKYLELPITANFISYGNSVVAAYTETVREIVAEYVTKFPFYHLFETPNLNWLSERLTPAGQKVCFMAEYYLPDLDRLRPLPCPYELRVLHPADFAPLYLPQWSNALCEKRRELDVLGVGAYDGETLVGLAACSADCESMWQIGVDVLPAYRRQGVASALTSRLALEILQRGKVPFYCSAWSNLPSVRNAVKSGFLPAWVEMTVKPAKIVDGFNR